ncbi:D-alanyl-D-alanine carboxypeptidase/D-alanyl-D-alanine-endopeptidase [Parabacteroides merdae]|uniref:D-alanyl-D-alanine carboxypeptidase/D-alanyl-D-alanine-endopeptidase n=1 Tax=Parabacteroides merdae TaxID=46503 RepID=A0A9Q4RG72_9BACT|nr:D-alanyl-D-alanine carboxypeptidase/D-alanyl-D-alanine-endopeptidase [Parabacteroides merdae]MRX89015.1 D-alanyl-D-alanine carboxypeptidase/D-alanyl-D-alanine-endopeptidase [Parabacteroides merdae]MTT10351.1 D-alanyl-D-alanine carboxypeptidase/D-alanyl-D-alanine-endopeptidase [Parabacteroides merdae]MTT14407.1 D-alanyl-D-alanine carboxypeptidase/D-alanyl-D-alanine-endopeptidase [Parabacteroides merdae]MTT43303.1 D-alanyl-D-alanine carboxypeptidase/D-alanyl-D-alanine-endopeptidase [Parabacter
MIRNKIVLLCLLICLHLLAGAQTPAPVKWLLQAPYMRGASFSLVVKDVQEGRTVYSYDTDRLQSPASVLKTVATATALEILGEDYRYPTTLEYDGILENGTLEGNLYIKGSGDPSLGSSHFAPGQNKFLSTWIAALQKAGIKHITGSVISDESIFDTEGVSIKWLREDMGNYYAPGSYGISIFDNMYKLSLQTGAAGTRPVLKGTEPDIPFIRFKNYLKAAPVSSDSAYIIGAPLDDVRYLYGVLPANREAYVLKGDIPDPALYLARYLTDQLQQKGIRVDGSPSCYRIEVEENRWKKGERKEIVTTYSPTLREIASICNHVSHNLYADALVKTVGLQYKPRRNEMISSFGRGVQVVKEYWEKKGLDVFPLRMNDGSGLAPADKVSAGFMGELLVYMATESAVSDAFIASLPQAGIEGSVRNFLKGSKLQGKAHLKSGGITGVRSYAGYITKDRKTYAVAVFSNNYSCPMSRMTRALEKLLLQLF